MRQAFAGMLWSKQLFNYDVRRWLDGDPGQPAPPASRRAGRNARWPSFNAFDIMSMPDKWEYPWFAAWDLAFHCVAVAHVDPGFAEYQPPDEPLSDRYIALAVEAWDQGVLSEGQLARLLRTTRLGAREIVQRLLPVDFPPHD